MKHTSILRRVMTAHALLAILVSLIGLGMATATTRGFYLDTVSLHLRQTAQAFVQSLPAAPPDLDRWVKETFRATGFRLTLVNRQGKVVADSLRDPARMEWHGDHVEVAAALNGKESADTRFSTTLGEQRMYYALPLPPPSRVAVLRIDMPLTAVSSQLRPILRKFAWFFLAILALALGFSWLSSRALSRPIVELDLALKRVATGDLDVYVPPTGHDEIARLASQFNAMVTGQKTLVEELRQRRQELEAIVSSMSDGLMVLDGEGRIQLHNGSLAAAAGGPIDPRRHFWEVFRDDRLERLYRESQDRTEPLTGVIDRNQRSFLTSWTRLPGRPETVVTFTDVSELKRLEQLKRDFVAALSHELRTPLTAIKGYLETLREEQGSAAHPYLDIIARHSERLILLARDLLSLSELEEKLLEPVRQPVDLMALLGDVLPLFERKIADKGLALTRPAASDPVWVTGDPSRLEQLLINLVDNAVKYTDRGNIVLGFSTDGRDVVLEVTDTGVGIPEKALPRIFDRFFVTDRARSRQSGGTGLGLAIVKHIVLQHGGKIEVESELGKGSTFRVRLAAANLPGQTSSP